MKYAEGNIWEIDGDAICITTNRVILPSGNAVMGAGLALQAKIRYPDLPKWLGNYMNRNGNVVGIYLDAKPTIITVPTKNDWRDISNLKLIEKSLTSLRIIAERKVRERILITPLGCGLGKLNWSVVKPLMEEYLDDTYVCVIT